MMLKTAEQSFPEKALQDVIKPVPSPFPALSEFRDSFRQKFPKLPDINEPGFASTFDYSKLKNTLWNYGGLLPVGALGAALWYANRPAPIAKKKKAVLEKQAAPDLKQILENIRWHLPKIRVPDTVAGSLAGAGAGGLYDLVRGKGKDGKRKTLNRVLTGALAGAGLSNLAGDRFRRYISNTKLPLGYRPNAAGEIKPSLKRIWNAAILDRPDYDQKAMDFWRTNPGQMLRFLPARHEIVRRQFGLPFEKKNPWWHKNQDGTYSLNEKSPDYAKRLPLMFGSSSHGDITRSGNVRGGPQFVLKNPEKALSNFSNFAHLPQYQTADYDFFGALPVLGGMQLPYIKNPDGSYSGVALDRWDVTPNKPEGDFFRKNLGKMLTNSQWRRQNLKDDLSWYLKPGQSHSNSSAMKAIGGRMVWDNILSDELPWISQKFKVNPRATRAGVGDVLTGNNTPYTLQFLKNDNTPATPDMGFSDLNRWDQNK